MWEIKKVIKKILILLLIVPLTGCFGHISTNKYHSANEYLQLIFKNVNSAETLFSNVTTVLHTTDIAVVDFEYKDKLTKSDINVSLDVIGFNKGLKNSTLSVDYKLEEKNVKMLVENDMVWVSYPTDFLGIKLNIKDKFDRFMEEMPQLMSIKDEEGEEIPIDKFILDIDFFDDIFDSFLKGYYVYYSKNNIGYEINAKNYASTVKMQLDKYYRPLSYNIKTNVGDTNVSFNYPSYITVKRPNPIQAMSYQRLDRVLSMLNVESLSELVT